MYILTGMLVILLAICACAGEAGESIELLTPTATCGPAPVVTISAYPLPASTCAVYEDVTITTDKAEYERGETINITITNHADAEMRVNVPFYTVERYDDGVWVEIQRVLCPCNAHCKIPSSIVLPPQGNISYGWDQMETWCSDPSRLSQTCSAQVPPGRYRVKSVISDPRINCIPLICSAEFTIN